MALHDSYFAQFGKFVSMFTMTETMWHLCFRAVVDIPDDVSRAITGDMRAGNLISILRRVAKVKIQDHARLYELETLAEQFFVISEIRDRLIHRGADPQIEKWVSSNEHTAKSLEDLEIVEFKEKDLENATNDLVAMSVRLTGAMHPDAYAALQGIEGIYEPWRYKRLLPHTPNRPPKEKKTPVGGRLPRTSQE